METLYIPPTKNTPEVRFDADQGIFLLQGNSLPENAGDFYSPIIASLGEHLPVLTHPVRFEFRLPYFNSSSLKAIYLILTEAKKAMDQGMELECIWYVEDQDEFMLDAGETFIEMVDLPLQIVDIPSGQDKQHPNAA